MKYYQLNFSELMFCRTTKFHNSQVLISLSQKKKKNYVHVKELHLKTAEIGGYIETKCVGDKDIPEGFGNLGHQHPLSFYSSVGHQHSKDVTPFVTKLEAR